MGGELGSLGINLVKLSLFNFRTGVYDYVLSRFFFVGGELGSLGINLKIPSEPVI